MEVKSNIVGNLQNNNFITTLVLATIVPVIIIWMIYRKYKLYKRRQESFAGKVVLVTGSGSGLGKALCLRFARENCHIICVDINQKGNEDTINKIREISNNVKARAFTLDITDLQQVQQLNETIQKEFPSGIDILVNNAGISHTGRITDLNAEGIQRLLNVNLLSHFWTIKTFLPKMLDKNSGIIVAIGSFLSHVPMDGHSSYVASKYGVLGLMETLDLELRILKSKIRTCTVCPYFMATNMLHKSMAEPGVKWLNGIPVEISNVQDFANKIIDAIKERRRIIIMPQYIQCLIYIGKLMPDFLGKWIAIRTLTTPDFILKNTGELNSEERT